MAPAGPNRGALQQLARKTAERLTPFGYYTELLVDDAKQAFEGPTEPGMTYHDEQVTLSFTLRSHRPAVMHRAMTLAVQDETVFNYFMIGREPDALALVNAPAGCMARIQSAREATPEPPETFWAALRYVLMQKLQDLGAVAQPGKATERYLVTCPGPA